MVSRNVKALFSESSYRFLPEFQLSRLKRKLNLLAFLSRPLYVSGFLSIDQKKKLRKSRKEMSQSKMPRKRKKRKRKMRIQRSKKTPKTLTKLKLMTALFALRPLARTIKSGQSTKRQPDGLDVISPRSLRNLCQNSRASTRTT